MRNIQSPQLPDTKSITDPFVLKYVRTLNLELDSFRRGLNKNVSKLVFSSVTSAATLNADDEVVLCNGTFTITLPPAASSEGKFYIIKNISSGTITINGSSSETIDNVVTITLIQDEVVEVMSDTVQWWII